MKKKNYINPSINVIKLQGMCILQNTSVKVNTQNKATEEDVGW